MKPQKSIFFSIVVLSFLLLMACHLPIDCVEGKGSVVEQTLELKNFEKIHLKNSTTVYLQKGDKQEIVVRGQQNLIDLLNRSVKDDTWEVRFEKCVRDLDEFEIRITLPVVTDVSIYGSGDVISETGGFTTNSMELNIYGSGDIKMNAHVKKLSSNIRGSGDIELKGSAVEHEISIAGSGDIKADNMESEESEVSIAGSGNVSVNVSEELEVSIMGSGDVYYKGNPARIEQDVKGSGEVRKKD